MAPSIPAPAPAELALAALQESRPRGRRMPWLMRLGLGVVALLALLAVVAPWVVQDPERQSLRTRLKPPTFEGTDGRAHLLGDGVPRVDPAPERRIVGWTGSRRRCRWLRWSAG